MKHRAPQSHEARCFPLSDFLPFFPDRERKRFLAFARNDNMGKAAFSYPPPSSGRRGLEGAEVGSPYELIRHVRGFPLSAFLTFFPDRKRKRFLAFARNDDMGKAAFSDLPPSSGRRDPEGAEVGSPYELIRHVRGFPLSAFLTFLSHRERKGFLAFARNDDMGRGLVLHPQQTKTALRGRALISPCQGRHGKYLKKITAVNSMLVF